MPLYMDIHTVDSDTFSVEDVVKAHMQDLAVQERFGVTQIKYWVNENAKTLFCLMEGPDKEACNNVHKESHGNTACNIIEVSDDEYNLFLGAGTSVNDLAHTPSGEIDTGYRTILLLNYVDFTGKYRHCLDKINHLIEKYQGIPVLQPDFDIMVSFIFASRAISCALAIAELLRSITANLEFTLSLASGRPVDEQGHNFFEETKKKVKCLSAVGMHKTLFIDAETKTLSSKERNLLHIAAADFRVIGDHDFHFLFQLFEIMNKEFCQPGFHSAMLESQLGLSKSQAYRKIKSLSGLAPNRFIQEIRLRQSLLWLKQKSKTIAEIAYDSGFNSPTYFARIFRKRFALTPSRFIQISSNN